MAKLLYITANPKPVEQSLGLSIGEEFLTAYQAQNPNDEIVKVDLFQTELQEIDGDVLSAWGKFGAGEQPTSVEMEKVQRMNQVLEQFIAGDKYVFVTPMWNFGFPPRMKTYIDSICIAGKTFSYTATGPVGLLEGKKALHIHSSGGVYSEGPAAAFNFTNPALQGVLQLIGVKDYASVIAEGASQMPAESATIKQNAITRVKEIAQSF